MNDIQNQRTKRSKTPLVLALILLLLLTVYGTYAQFSDSKPAEESGINLELGFVELGVQSEPWQKLSSTDKLVKGSHFAQVVSNDEFTKEITIDNHSDLPTDLTVSFFSKNLGSIHLSEWVDPYIEINDTLHDFSSKEYIVGDNTQKYTITLTAKTSKVILGLKVKDFAGSGNTHNGTLTNKNKLDLLDLKVNVTATQKTDSE